MLPLRRVSALALPGLLFAIQGCTDHSPTSADPNGDYAPASQVATPTSDHLEPIARGLAQSLADPAIRRQLLDDLRDSPFPKRKLHLQSYLASPRGAAIAAATAAAMGIPQERLLASLSGLPSMEFGLPRAYDRVSWTGTANIVTIAASADKKEIAAARVLTGYRTTGEAISVPMFQYVSAPLLYILPAETDFGSNPEAVRNTARRRSGRTISTPREEFLALTSDCPEPLGMRNRGPTTTCSGGGSDFGGYWLDASYSWSACTTAPSPDEDQDGIRDDCEDKLAYTFRPYLEMTYSDDNRGREPYWAVAKSETQGWVKIFYALSYYRDGGEDDTGFGSHDGDSEFIILQVNDITGTARWAMETGTLSAHWRAGWPWDGTGTWSYSEFEFPVTYRGRPRVWVAEEKHANYKTRSDCNWGAGGTDVCSNHDCSRALDLNNRRTWF